MNLDIAFSDHKISEPVLKQFGEVVRSIRRVCTDEPLRFWSFIHYVSTRHPEVLGVTMPDAQRQECESVVARANPPPVTFEESERAKMLREMDEKEADPGSGSGSAQSAE